MARAEELKQVVDEFAEFHFSFFLEVASQSWQGVLGECDLICNICLKFKIELSLPLIF